MRQYEEADIRKEYKKLTEILIRRGLTITTMESATAGQIASLITDTEGASAVIKGAYITYSNEAKVMQGVPEQLIAEYTVYSEEVAAAMACACRSSFHADLGIGVTGTMGNVDPKNAKNSVPGTVYFAISNKAGVKAFTITIPAQSTRLAYKLAVAKHVCGEVMQLLEKEN